MNAERISADAGRKTRAFNRRTLGLCLILMTLTACDLIDPPTGPDYSATAAECRRVPVRLVPQSTTGDTLSDNVKRQYPSGSGSVLVCSPVSR